MLQMTTAATKEAAFAAWEEIQYYCYSDYCPILMMGHFHQAAACTNRLTRLQRFPDHEFLEREAREVIPTAEAAVFSVRLPFRD